MEKLDSPLTFKVFRHHRLNLIVILLLTFLAYANIFRNQFVLDDPQFIVHWPLWGAESIRSIFWNGFHPDASRSAAFSPLREAVHDFNYTLFGQQPLGHHLFSLAVHFLGVVVVYGITVQLLFSPAVAFLCSLFFGLHPVHAEAVTYMTGSVETLGMVLALVSFWSYLKARVVREKQFSLYYGISVGLFLGSIFMTEYTLVFPLLLLWYEGCWKDPREDRSQRLARLAPYLVGVLFFVSIKFMTQPALAQAAYAADSLYLTVLIGLKSWFKSLALLAWPWAMNITHVLSEGIFSFNPMDFDSQAVLNQSFLQPAVWGALLTGIGLAVPAWVVRTKHPVILFAVGWIFLSQIPALNIIPSGIFLAERFLYLASFGFCLLLAYGILWLWSRPIHFGRPVLSGLCGALILLTAFFYWQRTWMRNYDWRHALVILKKAVAANPRSVHLRLHLADAFNHWSRPSEALAQLRLAEELKPQEAMIPFLMGFSYFQLGQTEKALERFERAIVCKKDFAEAYFYQGILERHLGRLEDSQKNLLASIYFYRQAGQEAQAIEIEQNLHSLDLVETLSQPDRKSLYRPAVRY